MKFDPDALLDAAQVRVVPKGTPVDWSTPMWLDDRYATPPMEPSQFLAWGYPLLVALTVALVLVVALTAVQAVREHGQGKGVQWRAKGVAGPMTTRPRA